MRRYDEWRYRVSDILDANLTRTLMLTMPPREGAKVKPSPSLSFMKKLKLLLFLNNEMK